MKIEITTRQLRALNNANGDEAEGIGGNEETVSLELTGTAFRALCGDGDDEDEDDEDEELDELEQSFTDDEDEDEDGFPLSDADRAKFQELAQGPFGPALAPEVDRRMVQPLPLSLMLGPGEFLRFRCAPHMVCDVERLVIPTGSGLEFLRVECKFFKVSGVLGAAFSEVAPDLHLFGSENELRVDETVEVTFHNDHSAAVALHAPKALFLVRRGRREDPRERAKRSFEDWDQTEIDRELEGLGVASGEPEPGKGEG